MLISDWNKNDLRNIADGWIVANWRRTLGFNGLEIFKKFQIIEIYSAVSRHLLSGWEGITK